MALRTHFNTIFDIVNLIINIHTSIIEMSCRHIANMGRAWYTLSIPCGGENRLEKCSAGNQSTLKALYILEYFGGRRNEPARLAEIARALHMNPSTAARFLASLAACGYVRQDPDTQRYALTAKLCTLAQTVQKGLDVRALAEPCLRELSARFDESACLAVEKDMEVVYVLTVPNASSVLRTTKRIGSLAPMHCTGVGKLLLLEKEPSYIDGLIAVKKLTAFTEKTITTRERLLQELTLVRHRGYAVDDEECETGVMCIAVPIYDCTDRIVAAMSLTGPAERMNAWTDGDRKYLMERAAALSRELGATM